MLHNPWSMSSKAKTIRRALAGFYRFLAQWNLIVAPAALVGYFISTFFPEKAHPAFFFDLGMVALLLLLIDIKLLLEKDRQQTAEFGTLRDAIPTILASMRKEMSGNHTDVLHIQVFASRLFTAGDMVRGILLAVADRTLQTHDVKFTIYCLEPDFVTASDTPDNEAKAKENAVTIGAKIRDLEKFNAQEALKSNNIQIDVIKYRTFPFMYAFLIGDESLYFGAITWSDDLGDFEGSGNPCYVLRSTDEGFRPWKQYLENRGLFYRRCSAKSSARQDPSPEHDKVLPPQAHGAVGTGHLEKGHPKKKATH